MLSLCRMLLSSTLYVIILTPTCPTWCNRNNHQTVQTTTLFLQCMMPTALVNIYKDMVYCCGEYLLGYVIILTPTCPTWCNCSNHQVNDTGSVHPLPMNDGHAVKRILTSELRTTFQETTPCPQLPVRERNWSSLID